MAGRPRKSQSAESVSAMQNELENNVVDLENETSPFTKEAQMQKEIDELKAAMKRLLENKENVISEKDKQEVIEEIEDLDDYNDIKIAQDQYIKVISLVDNELILTTKPYGHGGKPFTFRNQFEVKRILYSDLVDILESHPTFVENGYFYISDSNVIRKHGLDDVYKNILTKEKIERIMSGNSNDAVTLFKSANPAQQTMITEMLIKKLSENPDSIDLNMVDKISRASGVKIQEKAEEAREFAELMKTAQS